MFPDPRLRCTALIWTRDLSRHTGPIEGNRAHRRCRRLAWRGGLCFTHAIGAQHAASASHEPEQVPAWAASQRQGPAEQG